MAKTHKPAVGNVAAGIFIGLALIIDVCKDGIALLGGISIIGLPLSFIITWFISIEEFIFLFLPLYMMGAYRGSSGANSGLITLVAGMVDITPVLNDLPATTVAIIMVILKSRANDIAREKQESQARAHITYQEHEDQAAKESAAREVQSRLQPQQALGQAA